MKLTSTALVLALAAVSNAQDSRPTPAPPPLEPVATQPKSPAQEKLLAAKPEDRPKAIVAFIQDQLSTNALYAGQYAALAKVEGAGDLLQKWIKSAPPEVLDTLPFREACVRALRDVHSKEAPEALVKDLEALVRDALESDRMRQSAVYALAQFGRRSYVDTMAEHLTKLTKAESVQDRVQGFNGLANLHYQVRDYAKAVEAYRGLLGLHESGAVDLGEEVSTTYYNACCSMALAGMQDQAFQYLEKALAGRQLGRRMLQEDMDIASLRGDPRFAKLVEAAFSPKAKAGPGGPGKKEKPEEEGDDKDGDR